MSDGSRSTTTSGSSGDDNKALLNGDHKRSPVVHHEELLDTPFLEKASQEYEVDEVYKIMGTRSRATVFICFLISLVGETFAPFGIIAPLLQDELPNRTCLAGNCSTANICNIPRGSWAWINKHRTIISEFELHCADKMYTNLASAVFFVPGMAVGLLVAGYLSDKMGRKNTNIVLMTGSALSACAMGFSTSFEMYLTFQTLLGFTLGGTMVTRVLWMLEFVHESMRPYASAISAQFFCLGTALVPLADYYLQDWRMLDFIIAVYSIVCVLVMFWIPESPHWLVANNKTKQLLKTMQRLININKSKLNLKDIKIIAVPKHKESGNICIVFSDMRTLLIVLGLVYQWFLTSFLYYGFFHLVGTLNGTVHWNIAIMGMLEGPCLILAGLVTTKLGRRKTMMSLLVIVIVTCLVSLSNVTISSQWDLRRIFSLIGSKAGSGPMFFVVYIITLETMPTSIRSIGMCTCSVVARLGAASPPYFLDLCVSLHQTLPNLHYIIYIGLSALGVVITWFLPETKGTSLKQTLAASDTIKRNQTSVKVSEPERPVSPTTNSKSDIHLGRDTADLAPENGFNHMKQTQDNIMR